MQIHLSDISSSEGMRIQKTVEFGMDAITFQSGTFPVIAKEPIELTIVNTGDRNLEVTGTGKITVGIPCDRCLKPVLTSVSFDIDDTVEMEENASEDEEPEEKDYIDGYSLDVDRLVFGELLLSMPGKVLCKDDCKGLCPVCGTDLNVTECDCEKESLDPRMSVFKDILNNFKEV